LRKRRSWNREVATTVATGINTETSNREQEMPKFKVVTPKGASFTTAGGGYALEREALDPIGAEITEAPANEADFIAAAKGADAIYAKGMRISKAIIDALENCKVITLGSVGVDSVDVKAATARGIPVTNIPDTFIEEVADHAMMLLLAGFRRLIAQDRMVREGRWTEGRPALLKIPRLMGQTLGFISFGRVARAVAKRAAPFGLRMVAYDPFISETLISDHGVLPATLSEVLAQSDFVSMHAPARPEVHHMLGEAHFRQMKPSAIFINTGRGATVNEEDLIKALQEGWIAHAALDVLETEPPSHNNPMLSMDNVTMTAHVASASARFDEARKRRVGFELSLVLSGLWPASCVNPSVLQNTPLRRWQPVSMERGPNS
jgi:D-3-phosphoglycerate dehydrogenase